MQVRQVFVQDMFVADVRGKHEVVNDGPGFGVENAGMVESVEERRRAIDGYEGGNGNQWIFSQQAQLRLAHRANLHIFSLDHGVAVKLPDTLVEPQGKTAIIPSAVSVGVVGAEGGVMNR